MNSIRSTVQKALDASRPETSTHVMDSRMGATAVSESQSDYCDTSASADIVLALDPGPKALKLWIPRSELAFARMGNFRPVKLTDRRR